MPDLVPGTGIAAAGPGRLGRRLPRVARGETRGEGETGNARDYLTPELNLADSGELSDDHLRAVPSPRFPTSAKALETIIVSISSTSKKSYIIWIGNFDN